MKTTRKSITLIALIAVAGLALMAGGTRSAAAQGIGIYPTGIVFDDVLRGGDYFRTIGVNNGYTTPRTFTFESDGAAGPWLTIVDSADRTKVMNTFVTPGGAEARVLVRMTVPADAANGHYAGIVRVVAKASESTAEAGGGSGAGVNLGAEIDISANVTGTQKIEGALIDLAARDVEVGSPLTVSATVQNTGNVQIIPQANLQIVDTKAVVLGEQTYADRSVPPNETVALGMQWDTTGQRLGQRIARVSLKFGELALGPKEIGFNIVAVGTLTRQGELQSLVVDGKPSAGSVAKVVATFKNTGQIDSHARFVGEVYRDSERIQAATSEELLVEAAGGIVPLELFVDVPSDGTYTVRGKVNFEGKETDVREIKFKVGGGGISAITWGIGGVALVLATAVASGGWIAYRRRVTVR